MRTKSNLIGLSMSLCIRDVLEGRVNIEQIEKIFAQTRIETEEHLQETMTVYRQAYWSSDPDRGERIARSMLKAGRIEQPRITLTGESKDWWVKMDVIQTIIRKDRGNDRADHELEWYWIDPSWSLGKELK